MRVLEGIFYLLLAAGLLALAAFYVDRSHAPAPIHEAKVDATPANGLHLHRWYRPSQKLGWSWKLQQWRPDGDHGEVSRGVPLFVWERRGKVAVLRGAVRGELLVPDGDSAKWFLDAGDLPPVGDGPWPAEVVGENLELPR